MGQCFIALLNLTPSKAVPFIGRFLKSKDDDVRLEAAGALAQSREPEAIEILKRFWKQPLSPETRIAVVASLGSSPLTEAAEFLLSIVADESRELSERAIAALATSRFHAQLRDRTVAVIARRDDPYLNTVFERTFPGRIG